ncbi:protein of unknown function [Oryzisolibacter propanilivorax]|uniref:TMEM205-like domain-containing protein n=1 Tax=Oryzisolibacter propanilivorax TaxID=1527607 RepID=A0A1G9PH02_9BURK|nr:DUF4149 domain-containing protein [Oryzisolibacter propanilivorax]SDL97823.1 protein of unknown function [Oryzisolibacter propanilivorax]
MPERLRTLLPLLAAALWWGGLTAIGFMAVPLLFVHLPNPAMAGGMAAKLFQAQMWLSVGCALVLLLLFMPKPGEVHMEQGPTAMVFIVGGMLLALLIQFGVAPRIVARQDLRLWHGVGTVMYALQWLCALGALLKAQRR